MKAIRSTCISLFIMTVAILSLTACDLGGALHKCNYNDWRVLNQPTCEEKGLEQRFCEVCGNTQTKYTDALGHSITSYEAKQPTCTEVGWAAYEACARCDYSTRVEQPTVAHSYDEEKVCVVCEDCMDRDLRFVLSEDGQSYLVSGYDGTATDIIIPSRYKGKMVTGIGDQAFRGSSIKSVCIPKTVRRVGMQAFENCENLTSVYASSLSDWCSIEFEPEGDNGFGEESSISNYGFGSIYSNPMRYAEKLYIDGELLVDLVIPNEVKNISHFAFYSCEYIRSVTLHVRIETVGISAFCDCENIESVYITDIAAFCNIDFGEFPSEAALWSAANPMLHAEKVYVNGEPLTDLVIPDGVTYIPQGSFARCETLRSVYIPDSVEAIGKWTFEDAPNLESVVFENIENWMAYPMVSDEPFPIPQADLADAEKTADLFRNEKYKHCDWRRE